MLPINVSTASEKSKTMYKMSNFDRFAFGTLRRWHRIRMLQSIRLKKKKSNTVDTPYLAIEMKAGTTDKEESTAECQKGLSL